MSNPNQVAVPLLQQNPAGRVDVAAVRVGRTLVGALERNLGGANLWDNGVGELVETAVRENLPSKAYTLTDVARAAGLLPKKALLPRKGRRR